MSGRDWSPQPKRESMGVQPLASTAIVSYPIVLCLVAVEALNLVLLWIALRAPISRVARPLVACSGLSGAFAAWVLVFAVHGPLWMMALTGAVFVLSSAAMGVAIHLALCEEEERPDGGAGGAPDPSPEAPGGGGDGEPLWWPEFEREVTAYAAQRDRERQPVDGSSPRPPVLRPGEEFLPAKPACRSPVA